MFDFFKENIVNMVIFRKLVDKNAIKQYVVQIDK